MHVFRDVRLLRLVIALFALLTFVGLPQGAQQSDSPELTIATWNLNRYTEAEAFAPVPDGGMVSRSEFIGRFITEHSVDILALQEVSSCSPEQCRHIRLLANQLGGFDFIVSATGNTGGRHLVFLYRTSEVTRTGNLELDQIDLTGTLRGALVLRVKGADNGLDGTFITLHNDAGDSATDETNRRKQIELLDEWIENDMAQNPDEHDYTILGDFNEATDLPATAADEDEGRLDPLEDDFAFFPQAGACTTTAENRCSRLDHIALSKVDGGAMEELVTQPTVLSLDELGFSGSKSDYEEQVTDHFPVMAVLRNIDND